MRFSWWCFRGFGVLGSILRSVCSGRYLCLYSDFAGKVEVAFWIFAVKLWLLPRLLVIMRAFHTSKPRWQEESYVVTFCDFTPRITVYIRVVFNLLRKFVDFPVDGRILSCEIRMVLDRVRDVLLGGAFIGFTSPEKRRSFGINITPHLLELMNDKEHVSPETNWTRRALQYSAFYH